MDDPIFTKEALEEMDGKTLPLVSYFGGKRNILGEVTLHRVDNRFRVEDMNLRPDVEKLFSESLEGYSLPESINPGPEKNR